MPKLRITPEAQRIGATIRDIRERREVLQKDVAEQAGISARHYRDIERGRVIAKRFTYLKIARALDLTVEQMDDITGQGERAA